MTGKDTTQLCAQTRRFRKYRLSAQRSRCCYRRLQSKRGGQTGTWCRMRNGTSASWDRSTSASGAGRGGNSRRFFRACRRNAHLGKLVGSLLESGPSRPDESGQFAGSRMAEPNGRFSAVHWAACSANRRFRLFTAQPQNGYSRVTGSSNH